MGTKSSQVQQQAGLNGYQVQHLDGAWLPAGRVGPKQRYQHQAHAPGHPVRCLKPIEKKLPFRVLSPLNRL